jgi:hypothetical protein
MKRVIFIVAIIAISLFAFSSKAICQDFSFADPMNYEAGYGTWNIDGDDFNNDGLVDLFTANRQGSVSVMLNMGGGFFQPATNIYLMTLPYGVCSADIDGDGDKDIIAANHNAQGSITILINDGTGNFEIGPSYFAGSYGWSVTSADFDLDGDMDIAFSTEISANLYIFQNNGSGLFSLQETHMTGSSSHQVIAADLNKDGHLDIVVAGGISDYVSILINHGDGTFAAPVHYNSGNNVISVVVADFDNDGDKDLAPINYHGCSFNTKFNTGNGTFVSGQSFSYPDLPTYGIAADLDRDGWKDLIVTRQSSGPNIRIMRNQGSGHFVQAAELTCNNSPLCIYANDFDYDGDIDMATANLGTSDISVLLNLGITSIHPGDGSIPEAFALNQNYPNPFNVQTLISYDIPKDSHVTLEIFDILGHKITTLVNEFQQAGHYQAIWNANDFATGIYYGRLQAGGNNHTIKMTMIK